MADDQRAADELQRAGDERDRKAEEWLLSQYSADWYIGDVSETEWIAAYEAVDAEKPDNG